MTHSSSKIDVSITESQIAIVGAACRLPGSPNEAAFERLLHEGRSAISPRPEGRWAVERFYHPRTTEPGFSYSFAGGFLDNPFDFDASVFGMSPREAQQVDPQQRLLMEVVWEALEDARIAPSTLAGKEVGVYVGASSLDHGNLHAQDLASIDSHFMTGNTLSIVSNRISYAYDLRGPSFTVDTACSSSLVAFNQALGDLRLGRIDTAIVAGVNLLFSPASYVGFSRASMLSPTGLCRPFSDQGDGYVRSEGAVAIVLQRAKLAVPGSIRAYAVAAGVNSDGRTSGIALPGLDGQKTLLDRLYGEAGISPEALAFVEAHGTGTRVGDPIEAGAIGEALGQRRRSPLPIGSVKSNIGHLEPASGVAGIMKALIALKVRRLPQSLHLDALNPLIDFDGLNLTPARTAVALDAASGTLTCGVSSFGFGGTNAHVILTSAPALPNASGDAPATAYLMLSAASREALSATAREHAGILSAGVAPKRLATEIADGREIMKHRVVVGLSDPETMARQLGQFADHGVADRVAVGSAAHGVATTAFVYSGNGVQWVGMGRTAFRRNSAFRDRFTEIDQVFTQQTGESLIQNLFATDLAERLKNTGVVQPLIFAIQSATTHGLAQAGLAPDFVMGHSVGELAAATSAGAISLIDAIRIIEARAACQQEVQGAGLMAVFAASRETMEAFVDSLSRNDLEIACENGPTSITLSGSQEAIRLAARLGRKQRLASRILDFEYPFHSSLLERSRDRFLKTVGELSPVAPAIPMISTVTGQRLDGRVLDALYWWDNIRQPVLFRTGVETAIALGTGLFVEIGPKPILVGPIAETIKHVASTAQAIASLAEADERDAEQDPIAFVAARALSHGAALLRDGTHSGTRHIDRALELPGYAWQRKTYIYPRTSEGLDLLGATPRHPLIGSRIAEGQPEWRTLIDTDVVPYLADHVVDGETVVPGAALAEMVLAAARDLTPDGPIGFEDFDILQPLTLPEKSMREISVRHTATTGAIEIWSRPRLGTDAWTLHGRGRIVTVTRKPRPLRDFGIEISRSLGATVYEKATASGIDYGPAFQRIVSLRRNAVNMDLVLSPAEAGTGAFTVQQILHPASVDAALHGLFDQIKLEARAKRTYVPVRFGGVSVYRDHAEIVGAELTVIRETDHSVLVFVSLLDADGAVVAELADVLLQAVVMARQNVEDPFFYTTSAHEARLAETVDLAPIVAETISNADIDRVSDGWLMLRAHMRATAHASLLRLTGGTGILDLADAQTSNTLAPAAVAYAAMLAQELIGADMAAVDGDRILLNPDSGLPDADAILLTVAAEFPAASAELRLAASTAAGLDRYLATGVAARLPGSIAEQFEIDSLVFAASRIAVTATVQALVDVSGAITPAILLLEPNCRGLLVDLALQASTGAIRLTLAGMDRQRLTYLTHGLPVAIDIRILDLSTAAADPLDAHDVAILASTQLDGSHHELLVRASAHLAPRGCLLAVQPPVDSLVDFYFGTDPAWFAGSLETTLPIGRSANRSETEARLAKTGWTELVTKSLGDGACDIILARPAPRPASGMPGTSVLIAGLADHAGDQAPSPLGEALIPAIRAIGGRVIAEPIHVAGTVDRFEQIEIIELSAGDDLIRIEWALGDVKAALDRAAAAPEKFRLWLILRGAGRLGQDPVVDAIAGFARVAINEYDKLDLRIVDVDRALDDAAAAHRIVQLIANPTQEREVRLAPEGNGRQRIHRGLPLAPCALTRPQAMTLDFPRRGMLEHFQWQEATRQAPGPDEVEIEVIATGLNFRDVMLAMGLLGDDVLDDGMAGAVFGFECVGRVVATGTETRRFGVDEIVVGFAASAFASHVAGPEAMFIPLPAGLAPEAAATIPVAFLTAWYGLVELARLKRGERVLIHGAAGGVGLAAMQIARARGAEIYATASSTDKRALADLFGATHVFDSRSLDFADRIRTELGGVDVVLNSLSGDAMRAGLKCLKPFGRFIELGKRDYVANTELGLRPFRRNLTYFGVDLDQLLAHNPEIVAKGLKYVAAGLSAGRFTALPYRAYNADEIGTAFRLMQSAGHVGKIVIRPPVLANVTVPGEPSAPLQVDDGVQLVIGGTGGFGLATALWLAENGATRIVVASRRGAIEPTGLAAVTEWRTKGVLFAVERVDVTDLVDVEALVAKVARRHGAITGVFHSAMVLNDGLIADLDAARLQAVLAPKVEGASYLDWATRKQPIKRFVLYSSATTLIGNPAQAAYVAANAYLQGLARRRVAEGLPALSVAWGAILDAGVVARDAGLARKLERMTGVIAMPAREALDHLGKLLRLGTDLADPAITCARFKFSGVGAQLPILSTPAFASVFARSGSAATSDDADLAAMVMGKSEPEARRLLAEIVAGEVARILRLPVQEVDLDRPLSELGMDSLMALELRMCVEAKFGIELPLVAITAVNNLRDLAGRILQTLTTPDAAGDDASAGDRELILIHGGDEAAYGDLRETIEARKVQVERVI